MKPILKILLPVLFMGAIVLFVGYKSGWFAEEAPPPEPEKRVTETPQPQKQDTLLPPEVIPQAPQPVVSNKRKKERADTVQQVEVKPVIMPGSKSTIMINPSVEK